LEGVAFEMGMDVGHERAVLAGEGDERFVEARDPIERGRPRKQTEAVGVARPVARVVNGADHEGRAGRHQGSAQIVQDRVAVFPQGAAGGVGGLVVAVGLEQIVAADCERDQGRPDAHFLEARHLGVAYGRGGAAVHGERDQAGAGQNGNEVTASPIGEIVVPVLEQQRGAPRPGPPAYASMLTESPRRHSISACRR
jgi:hypothetical protein